MARIKLKASSMRAMPKFLAAQISLVANACGPQTTAAAGSELPDGTIPEKLNTFGSCSAAAPMLVLLLKRQGLEAGLQLVIDDDFPPDSPLNIHWLTWVDLPNGKKIYLDVTPALHGKMMLTASTIVERQLIKTYQDEAGVITPEFSARIQAMLDGLEEQGIYIGMSAQEVFDACYEPLMTGPHVAPKWVKVHASTVLGGNRLELN